MAISIDSNECPEGIPYEVDNFPGRNSLIKFEQFFAPSGRNAIVFILSASNNLNDSFFKTCPFIRLLRNTTKIKNTNMGNLNTRDITKATIPNISGYDRSAPLILDIIWSLSEKPI